MCDAVRACANGRAAEIAQVAWHQRHDARRRERQYPCACGDEQGKTLGWQRLAPALRLLSSFEFLCLWRFYLVVSVFTIVVMTHHPFHHEQVHGWTRQRESNIDDRVR